MPPPTSHDLRNYRRLCDYTVSGLSSMLQAREHYEAWQAARKRQPTEESRQQSVARAGVEGTHAQGIRRCGLRQSRLLGLAKTHLQSLLTAAALDVVWLDEWFTGTPLAGTRGSPLATLQGAFP
jgi:hypothetical protein